MHVDGRVLGRTPVLYVHGREARIRVRLTMKGYRPWHGEVDVPLNAIGNLKVTLVPVSRPRD